MGSRMALPSFSQDPIINFFCFLCMKVEVHEHLTVLTVYVFISNILFIPQLGRKGLELALKWPFYMMLSKFIHQISLIFYMDVRGINIQNQCIVDFTENCLKFGEKEAELGRKLALLSFFFLNTVLETFFIFCMMVDYHEYFKNLYLFLSTQVAVGSRMTIVSSSKFVYQGIFVFLLEVRQAGLLRCPLNLFVSQAAS